MSGRPILKPRQLAKVVAAGRQLLSDVATDRCSIWRSPAPVDDGHGGELIGPLVIVPGLEDVPCVVIQRQLVPREEWWGGIYETREFDNIILPHWTDARKDDVIEVRLASGEVEWYELTEANRGTNEVGRVTTGKQHRALR